MSDYPGFDEASRLDRPGVFRLNLSLGPERFTEVFGSRPSEFPAHAAAHDFAEFDVLFPHPAHAAYAWASVVNPGPATAEHLDTLIDHAWARDRARHERHP